MSPAAPGSMRRLLRRRLVRRQRHALTPWERKDTSQSGEDGVIEEILRRIATGPRFFVEFGVGPGVEGNCVRLADSEGWSGLFMESDPGDHAGLARKYAHVPAARTRRARVAPDNINQLLREESVPADFDLLSIDIDGNDYWVWRALSERFRPRLVVIEYNGALGTEAALVQPLRDEPWDATDYFGASIRALQRLGRAKGYRLVHTDSLGANAFFVREPLAGPLPPEHQVPLHPPSFRLPPDPLARAYIDLDYAHLTAP